MKTQIFHALLLCSCAASAFGQTGSVSIVPSQFVTVTSSVEPLPLADSDRSGPHLRSHRSSRCRLLRISGRLVAPRSVHRSPGARSRRRAGRHLPPRNHVEQNLVLVDGLRLNDLETGHLNLDLPIPLEGFSSIDVLHGSGSTFYGSDAIGGAVNFITQQPSRSEVAIRVGGGTFNSTEQHLRADWVNQSHGFLKAEKLTSSVLNQSFPTIRSYQSASSGRIGQYALAFVAFLAILAMCFQ